MFNSLAAMTLERALARVLGLDPPTAAAVRALAGHSLELALLPGPLYLTLHFTSQGVNVDGCSSTAADARVRLDPVALVAVLEGSTPATSIPGLEIRGDTALAAELFSLFRQLRPDMLGPLRGLLGPGVIGVLERTAARAGRHGSEAGEHIRRAGRDWLTSSQGPLPDPTAIAAQLDEIDALRLATDRLQARVQLLEQQLQQRSDPDS